MKGLFVWNFVAKYLKIVIPLAILIVAVYAAKIYFTPSKDVTSLKPDIKVSAEDLIKDFDADAKVANDKYLGKVLLIDGVLDKMESHDDAGTSINFDLKTDYLITFQFDEKLSQYYEEGTPLKIKGQYNGYIEGDEIFEMPGSILINQSKIEH